MQHMRASQQYSLCYYVSNAITSTFPVSFLTAAVKGYSDVFCLLAINLIEKGKTKKKPQIFPLNYISFYLDKFSVSSLKITQLAFNTKLA